MDTETVGERKSFVLRHARGWYAAAPETDASCSALSWIVAKQKVLFEMKVPQVQCMNWIYKRKMRNQQGWAGIPVPGHSQEWEPLIPVPELWEWIFLFRFCFVANSYAAKTILLLMVAVTKTRRGEKYQEWRMINDVVENILSQNFFSRHRFCKYLFIPSYHFAFFFPFLFPGIPGNDSLCFPFPRCGNGLFHSLPVHEHREWN